MPLLLDTYNVLHAADAILPDAANDVAALIKLIERSRYRDQKTTLACDGVPQPKPGEPPLLRAGNFTIRYSGKGKTADDLIAALVRASTAPRNLIVISSDHQVQKHARKRRCRIMNADEFLHELAADAQIAPATPIAKPPSSMSQEQIDKWVKAFKIDEHTLALQSRGSAAAKTRKPGEAPTATEPSSPETDSSTHASNPAHQIKHLARGEGLPEDYIEQAEQLWDRENRT